MKSRNIIESFKLAFRGIYISYITQRNFRIQVSFAILVIYFGLKFKVGITNFILLLFSITLVLTFELINTSIEYLSDKIESKFDLYIKNSKDILAGAVLITSICSLVIGILVFYKYIRLLTIPNIIISIIIILLPIIIKFNNDIIIKRGDE